MGALPFKRELDALYAPDHIPPANTAFWINMASQLQVENNPSPDDQGFRDFRRNPPTIGDIIIVKSNTGYSGSLCYLHVGQVLETHVTPNGLNGDLLSMHNVDPHYNRYPVVEFRGPYRSNIADSRVDVIGTYHHFRLGAGTLWRPVSEVALAGGSKRRKSRRRSKKRRSTR